MYSRNDRLVAVIREELSRALRTVKDPGLLGLMTITDVGISPDRKRVSVFYSVYGSPKERESTARALDRSRSYLRQVIKRRLTMKVIPELEFTYDETPYKASRVEQLLADIDREKEA